MLEVKKLQNKFRKQIEDNKNNKSLTYLQIANEANVTEKTVYNAVKTPQKIKMETLERIKNATEAL